MSDPFFLVVATVFGAMIGSFSNAMIYRIPRRMENQRFGTRSACPTCKALIPLWLNVPVFSWLWLRGRAACCGTRISWRYPLVEVLTAGLFFLLAYAPPAEHPLAFGPGGEAPPWSAFLGFLLHGFFVANLLINTFIDFDFRILPDKLTYPLIAVGLIGAIVLPGLAGWMPGRLSPAASSLFASIAGLAVGWGLTWAVRALAFAAFRKEAMGFGDVKLMGGVGAFLGWQGALLTFMLGCLSGAVFGVVHKAITKDSYIAFGPFLVLGALVTLFLHEPILEFATVTWPTWQRENLSSPFAMGTIALICLALLVVLIRRGRSL